MHLRSNSSNKRLPRSFMQSTEVHRRDTFGM